MKVPLLVVVALFTAMGSFSQSAQPRRIPTLDQFGLPSQSVPKARSGIWVDKKTFELLLPVTKYSKTIEDDYNAVFILRNRQVEYSSYYGAFKRKTMAIYRSVELIRNANLTNTALGPLKEVQQNVRDMHATIFYMPGGDNAPYKGELVTIYQRYSIPDPEPWYDGSRLARREEMLTAMLSRMNANFAQFYTSDR